MTAEMVVMNRSAVALAADSAVTITSRQAGNRPGIRKIYANANKLFELVRGRPVGMLIYSSADLVQVPWETLVKVYRSRNPRIFFDELTGYVDSFCEFLNSCIGTLIPEELSTAYFEAAVAKVARDVVQMCEDSVVRRVETSTSEVRVNNAFRKAVLEETLVDIENALKDAKIDEWADGLDEDGLMASYKSAHLPIMPDHFDGLKLIQKLRVRILRVAYSAILRTASTPSTTGIAIAGFGESELFPTLAQFRVGGIIAGRLVTYGHVKDAVTAERPSILRPLAQTGEATTFLTGIDPVVREKIQTFWQHWLESFGEISQKIIQAGIASITSKELDELKEMFETYGNYSWNVFADYMNKIHHDLRYGPIESSAAYLSKSELASLAENLVELASLRNRVSIDRAETVGGATDVAVVSPGDGFVWIKRKHYFGTEKNPTWVSRQLSQHVLSDKTSNEEG